MLDLMPDLGKYAVEILLSYAITIALLSALAYVYFKRARELSRRIKKRKDEQKQ